MKDTVLYSGTLATDVEKMREEDFRAEMAPSPGHRSHLASVEAGSGGKGMEEPWCKGMWLGCSQLRCAGEG